MSGTDSKVDLNAATVAGGASVRTVEVDAFASDGSTTPVEQQVVTIADGAGSEVPIRSLLEQILVEGRRQTAALMLIASAVCNTEVSLADLDNVEG